MRIRFFPAFLSSVALAAPAAAQWQPQWTTFQPATLPRIIPHDVVAAPDGTAFASGFFSGGDGSHPVVLRFAPDGALAWSRELGPVALHAGILRLSSGRVAVFAAPEGGPSASVRMLDPLDGTLEWERTTTLGDVAASGSSRRSFAEGADGEIAMALTDLAAGTIAIQRHSPDGTALDPWTWRIDERGRADALVARAAGGFATTGALRTVTGLDAVNATTAFDAQGDVAFEHLEAGDAEYLAGASFVAEAADGGLLAAADFAGTGVGDGRGTVWKIAADGTRSWRTFLDDSDLGHIRSVQHFLAAANGDALVVVRSREVPSDQRVPDRLVRLSGEDGGVRWERDLPFTVRSAEGTGPLGAEGIALAPNGRILAVGYALVFQAAMPRAVEYAADGRPCRVHDDETAGIYTRAAAAAAAGDWSVLGRTSTQMFVQRFDATGACDGEDADRVFADGFEPSVP